VKEECVEGARERARLPKETRVVKGSDDHREKREHFVRVRKKEAVLEIGDEITLGGKRRKGG